MKSHCSPQRRAQVSSAPQFQRFSRYQEPRETVFSSRSTDPQREMLRNCQQPFVLSTSHQGKCFVCLFFKFLQKTTEILLEALETFFSPRENRGLSKDTFQEGTHYLNARGLPGFSATPLVASESIAINK